MGVWEGCGKDEARKAGTGAEVGDAGRLAELRNLETREAVGDVDIDGLDWLSDGRGRVELGVEGG